MVRSTVKWMGRLLYILIFALSGLIAKIVLRVFDLPTKGKMFETLRFIYMTTNDKITKVLPHDIDLLSQKNKSEM